MKRRNFIKVMLAAPAALAMPFKAKAKDLSHLEVKGKQRDFPLIDLERGGNDFTVSFCGPDGLWIGGVKHPNLVTKIQFYIDNQ